MRAYCWNMQDKKIFVDPVSDYADYTQQPKADFILITHEHGDHFDTKAIAAIETNQTKIIANPNCRKMLNRGQEMKNGDVLQLAKDIKLEAVPAYNTTPGRDKFHPKGRDNGYILTLGGTRIYIAGDTEDIPELNLVKDIDIAFLPVNQPYTMTPEQAIRATQIIKPRILYPYHYGDTDINKVKEGLKNEKTTEVRIRLYNKARTNDYKSSADKLKIIVSTQYTTVLSAGKTPSR